MAVMSKPAEDQILSLMSISSLSREDSILMLEFNNNDTEKAINQFFDDTTVLEKYRGEKIQQNQWNEELFMADRDGNGVPSFHVQGPDVGPTRPNSRMAKPSSSNGVIDLSGDAAAGALWEQYYDPQGQANPPSYAADPNTSWGANEHHDAEMEQALRNSLLDAGLGQQESGVMPSRTLLAPENGTLQPSVEYSENGVQFGPANRNTYNTNEWAMVPLGNSAAHEIYLDPDPNDRRRIDGAPAFLKPCPDDNGLGWLLTIFHEIPITRELLLRKDHSCSDYGYDPEWWIGRQIEAPKLVVAADGEGDIEGVAQNHDMTEELQRITAFLANTTRSYGSVENVTRMLLTKYPNLDVLSKFFSEWQDLLDKTAFTRLFSVAVQPSSDDKKVLNERFMFLEVSNSSIPEYQTLYDCLDSAMWSTSSLELENSAFLQHLGEVLVFKLSGKTTSKAIDIPLVWYPDRYLESNREAALYMRKQKYEIHQQITKLDWVRGKLINFTKDGKTLRVRELINSSLQHDVHPPTETTISTESDTKMDDVHSGEKKAALDYLSDQLRRTIISINKKLDSLEKEKEKAQASLQELSRFYTEYEPGMHTYTLRGVCTSSTTTFVKKVASPESDVEMSDTNHPHGRWWRLSFMKGDQYPVNTYEVAEDIVMEEARQSIDPILVYASEQAMQPRLTPLSEPLSQFVEKDNTVFSNELPKMTSWSSTRDDDNPPSLPDLEDNTFTRDIDMMVPSSPGKRKFSGSGEQQNIRRQSRRGSMDVNLEDDEDLPEIIPWGEPPTPPIRRKHSQSQFNPDRGAGTEIAHQREMVQRESGPSLQMLAASAIEVTDDMTMNDDDDVMPDAEAAVESNAVKELAGGSS